MSKFQRSLPQTTTVEVDLIPYVDVVTLLLMFMLIIGDMASSTANVKMKLPRADQALNERIGLDTSGRIVVQLKGKADGTYVAVVENHLYDLLPGGRNVSLTHFLKELVRQRTSGGESAVSSGGEAAFPVKLRIPASAPMYVVERVVTNCARAGLVNLHYAAEISSGTN